MIKYAPASTTSKPRSKFQTLSLENSITYTLREKRRILSFSGAYFPAFGLNTERYRVFLREKCPYSKFFWFIFSRIRFKRFDLESQSCEEVTL